MFFPKNSVFLHYFKDKYPEMDSKSITSLASSLLSTVRASVPPVSSSRTSSESSGLDTISIPDDARSMEWDNYNSSPSFEFPKLSPGAPSPSLSDVPTPGPNITLDLVDENDLDATEDENESLDEEDLDFNVKVKTMKLLPPKKITEESDLLPSYCL